MKRTLTVLVFTIALTLSSIGVYAVESAIATPSKQVFTLDGEVVALSAYSIGGANYVKLRDICRLLDYNLTYESKNGVLLFWVWTEHSYDASGEANSDAPVQSAEAKPSSVYGRFNQYGGGGNAFAESLTESKKITAYNIDGSNYVQLRDFAALLNEVASGDYPKSSGYCGQTRPSPVPRTFDVRYDPTSNSIHMFSNTAYTGRNIGDNSMPSAPPPSPSATPTPSPVRYTSPPILGDQPARIMYDDGTYTKYYSYNGIDRSDRIGGGDCMWYAYARFFEVHNQIPREQYWEGDVSDNLDTIWNIEDIRELSIAVYYKNGSFVHVLFIEYVERDASGKPVNVYFTEGNTQHDGRYHPGSDGLVQKLTFSNFKQRGSQTLTAFIVPKR